MAGFLKKALSSTGLVEFTDESTTTRQKPVKTSPSTNSTDTAPQSGVSAIPRISNEEIAKFQEHFDQLLKGANLPGPDYFEYSKVEETLEAHIPNEAARMVAAFESLRIQNLTKQKLIESAQHYIGIIEKDRDGFAEALKAKQESEIGGRKKRLEELQKSIMDSKEQIELLEKTIAQAEADTKTIQAEITSFDEKTRKNEAVYLTACDALIQKISSDVEKANTTLK